MKPSTLKTLLRGLGTVCATVGTALVAIPETTPYAVAYRLAGGLLVALGGLLVGKTDRSPGDVSATDLTAILNAARAAIEPGASLTIKSSAPPKPTAVLPPPPGR
jgi:hypothetical protein